MREISQPGKSPFHCAIVPFVTQGHAHARWVDTGSTLGAWEETVFVSDIGLVECLRVLGLPTPAEAESLAQDYMTLKAERDALLDQVERLEDELEEERRVTNAIDVLESRDFTSRRKAGRPKKEVA